jgi:hypothetical protein
MTRYDERNGSSSGKGKTMSKKESVDAASMHPIVHTPSSPWEWTIEEHGKGYALYSGRGPMTHGMNLVYMSEPDSNWQATKRLIESVPSMVRALKAIVNHQDMIGGELAKMSTTRHIAAQAVRHATGEVA